MILLGSGGAPASRRRRGGDRDARPRSSVRPSQERPATKPRQIKTRGRQKSWARSGQRGPKSAVTLPSDLLFADSSACEANPPWRLRWPAQRHQRGERHLVTAICVKEMRHQFCTLRARHRRRQKDQSPVTVAVRLLTQACDPAARSSAQLELESSSKVRFFVRADSNRILERSQENTDTITASLNITGPLWEHLTSMCCCCRHL